MKCSRFDSRMTKVDIRDDEFQALCRECFAKIANDPLLKVSRRLLPLNDAISLVTTAHLLSEYCLDRLIELKIRHPRALLPDRLSFLQKLCLAETLGLFCNEEVKAVRALNNIRNHLSHNLEYQLTPKDLNELQALQKHVAPLYKEKWPFEDILGSLKAEFIIFYFYLASYTDGYIFSHDARVSSPKLGQQAKTE